MAAEAGSLGTGRNSAVAVELVVQPVETIVDNATIPSANRRPCNSHRAMNRGPSTGALVVEAQRRETVERVEVPDHRRRIGLSFARLARRLPQAIQVEPPLIASPRTR